MEATIKLFKALPIKSKRKKTNKELMERTIKKGFIFSPEVIYNYSDYDYLIDLVEKSIGITAEKLNSSFHKSWVKIKEASIEQLVIEQIIHYFTTYGFESLGIYNEDSVYIPNEKLEIPDLDIDGINLVVIKGYTKEELKEKLLELLGSGIALGEDTIKNILDIAIFVELNEGDIGRVKNKEVKSALYEYLNLFPENPVEFLRYLVYRATGETLLIKNFVLIDKVKESENLITVQLLNQYKIKYGLHKLAEIFYRFKPIFLAFKNDRTKSIINKIRKLATKYHKPMSEDYLNSVTAKVKNGERITKKKLREELSKVNIFRKIRLAYALRFRTKDTDSILYRIRNGKGYAKGFNFENQNSAKRILDIVLDSIVKDIEKNVKGKKFYIPEYITYTLPATEKQFTDYFPSGTYVSIPEDMIVGVNWKNTKRHRVDLDFSTISIEGRKIGWDSSYRTSERDILFSGDMTDAPAPKGATELIYVQRQFKNPLLILLNYYNYQKEVDVPFKLIVAQEKVDDLKNNYVVNPNNLIAVASSNINQKQKILGLLIPTTNSCRFYFVETSIGMSISSCSSDYVKNSLDYLVDFYSNTISLKDILEKAGAKFTDKKEKADVDLSPEKLEKDSILNILK